MSASDKKKLRKEQNAAALTEKQKAAKKEAKTLKAYTLSFIVVMVLVVSIVLGVVLKAPITGLINRSITAVTIGDRKISSAEFNYFYIDTINGFYKEQYDKYSSYGDSIVNMLIEMYTSFSPATPVGDQLYNVQQGTTWADYFIDEAKKDARLVYAMYDEAMAKNYKLPAEEQSFLDQFEDYQKYMATMYGYNSANGYLRATYGDGADIKSYKEYYEVCLIAGCYSEEYYNSLIYTDTDYRNYEKDKFNEFSSFSFAHHYVKVSDYLTGGKTETDKDGNTTTTYSEEEKAAALKAAKEIAESLAIADNNTVEKLNAAIAALEKKPEDDSAEGNGTAGDSAQGDSTEKDDDKKEEEKIPEAEVHKNYLYSSLETHVIEKVLEWLVSSDRKDAEITCIADATKNSDNTETVNGYYVVLYMGRNDNNYKMGTVRHLLVKFAGGTEDESGKTVYSEAEKLAARTKAETILNDWKSGEKVDEESFTALVKEKSEDGGTKSSGGLIESITWNSGYVDSFTEWAIGDHKAGDTGIIESEYGYHVMYYVEGSELSYRDTMIKNAMAEADYTAWEEAIVKDIAITDGNLSRLNRKFVVVQ